MTGDGAASVTDEAVEAAQKARTKAVDNWRGQVAAEVDAAIDRLALLNGTEL